MQDGELIKRVQDGDESALDEIVQTYYDEIYRFLCRKLGNSIDAEDVAQTVFVKFIGSVYSYSEKGKFRNYLFKVAVNAGNDFFRKSVNYTPLDDIAELHSNSQSPEQIASEHFTSLSVQKALQELPTYQRDVIVLRFYHDLQFKDIAGILNTGVSSAKSRYRQGMDKLRILLKEVRDDE